jgi:phosphohistidine swiveling domain-containing protein
MTAWVADTLASERYPIYTRANAGEVMPDPVSPLTACFGLSGPGELGWRDAYVRAGTLRRDEFDVDRPNCVGVFGGYVFLNMSLTRIYGVRMPGLSPEMVDLQYFGDMPGITPYADEARPTDVDEAASAAMVHWLQVALTRTDLPELRADRVQVDRLVAARPDLASLSDQELVDHARSFLPLYRRLFCRHIQISAMSGVGLAMVGQACQAAGRPQDALVLVAGVGDVDSAAPSWALWDLGRIVAGSRSLREAFDDGIDGLQVALDALVAAGDEAAVAFRSRFGDFLRRFGSRGPNEWELRSQTWGTRPEIALAAIDRIRLAPDGESPQERTDRRVREREVATAAVRAALASDPEAAGAFEAGLGAAHRYGAGRERTKTNTILVVHEMRLALRAWGERLVARGQFDRVEQVFMLVDDELDAAVEDPTPFVEVVREREGFYRSLFELEPPFVTNGPPPPVTQWARRGAGAAPAPPGAVLAGIPGSPGRVVGRARVVLDPADPRGLQPGEVLVAPLTDPAWTPLFVPAAAVVVAVGAQVTHAVIVSRELGLPCVVSVGSATSRIPDGALVEVDGTAGTVTVLDVPSEA